MATPCGAPAAPTAGATPSRRWARRGRGGPGPAGHAPRLLDGVAVVCWLMGSARGDADELAALHGTRLESLLGKLVDTHVRGFVYEAAAARRRSCSMGRWPTWTERGRPSGSRWRRFGRIRSSTTHGSPTRARPSRGRSRADTPPTSACRSSGIHPAGRYSEHEAQAGREAVAAARRAPCRRPLQPRPHGACGRHLLRLWRNARRCGAYRDPACLGPDGGHRAGVPRLRGCAHALLRIRPPPDLGLRARPRRRHPARQLCCVHPAPHQQRDALSAPGAVRLLFPLAPPSCPASRPDGGLLRGGDRAAGLAQSVHPLDDHGVVARGRRPGGEPAPQSPGDDHRAALRRRPDGPADRAAQPARLLGGDAGRARARASKRQPGEPRGLRPGSLQALQ